MLLPTPDRFIKVSLRYAITAYCTLVAVVLFVGFSVQTDASNLQMIEGCQLVDADWSDGDSFPIITPDQKTFTVRLYATDCINSTVTNTTDARRLRAHRRYFGITQAHDSSQESIKLAKELGSKATVIREDLLSKKFTVHTAFTDARGVRRYKRYYAFVTLEDGRDLAAVLVEQGLARAFGVNRQAWDGQESKAYEASLKDLEMLAAKKEHGIWAHTDWHTFITARKTQREDDQLMSVAIVITESISINTASRDELMQLPVALAKLLLIPSSKAAHLSKSVISPKYAALVQRLSIN